jgi:hypothetical protein
MPISRTDRILGVLLAIAIGTGLALTLFYSL